MPCRSVAELLEIYRQRMAANCCASCGSKRIFTELTTDGFTYGVGGSAVELFVKFPVRCCEKCGFKFLDCVSELVKLNAVYGHLGNNEFARRYQKELAGYEEALVESDITRSQPVC